MNRPCAVRHAGHCIRRVATGVLIGTAGAGPLVAQGSPSAMVAGHSWAHVRAPDRAPDSLTGPGVSRALAVSRQQTLRDIRYTLSLDVTRRDTAHGRVEVAFLRRGTSDVVLDFRGTGVDSVTVNGRTIPADQVHWNGAHIVLRASWLAEDNRVAIAFRAPIAAAGASIIRAKDATDDADYLYTLLVPSDANLLFPCFDQPDLKARVTLSLTTPHGWRALANGAAIAADSGTRATTHRFAETPLISTYLIAFAAGPWSITTRPVAISNGAAAVPMSIWTRASRTREAEADTLIATNARALRWLGAWFGADYPFGKYDFLLAPAFPFGGMEHPGAVFYNEESFIYRERPTTTQLLGRQATIYHEVAHQWFGDYMTMQWFDDLWLKEGFATYMAAKMQASLDPSSNAWKTFYLRNKPVAYGTDATAGTTPVWQELANLDQAKSNYGPIVYNKAPGILKQLNYLVGERAFQAGVQQFVKRHAFANATWRDLLHAIGTAAGRDLLPWGQAWILRPGMPIVEQHLRVRDGRIAQLRLTQRPAQPAISGTGAWPLKMQLLLAYDSGRVERLPVELRSGSLDVVAARGRPAPRYVFANDGDYGYAIILPDSVSVSWLEQHIGEERDDFLRAMLWGALWDLVREAKLSPERFALVALREIPRERDEQLVGTLVGRLSTALTRYANAQVRDALLPMAEPVLLAGANDTSRPYGPRKNFLDATISLARSDEALRRIDGWLDLDSVSGIALRPPTRWTIVTRLVSRNAPTASARLSAEQLRDSTTEGRRLAFVADAARPDSANKAVVFTRWFADRELNEEWVTSSLRAFHDPEQSQLTRRFLEPSLDTLPWIQQNRRIFFLGSWLAASLGGQASSDARTAVDEWLRQHPALPLDLRRKILQNVDDMDRILASRQRFDGT